LVNALVGGCFAGEAGLVAGGCGVIPDRSTVRAAQDEFGSVLGPQFCCALQLLSWTLKSKDPPPMTLKLAVYFTR
jgi:hypothetical protein